MTCRWLPSALITCLPLSAAPPVDFQQVPGQAKIESPAIAEASGVAVSPGNPDFLWIINDSGAAAEIHLVGTDGTDRGKVTLKDSHNIDWEDISSFVFKGKSHLLIADTGDNQAARESCTFYIVAEPDLPAAGKTLDLTVKPTWRIDFRYEGGPRDCEAAAVDAAAGKIVFLSKRTHPPELYELPLRAPSKPGVQVARKTGQTEVKPVGISLLPFTDQPTGMDISADGSLATVVTYHAAFLFPRGPRETWAEAFARKGIPLPPHRLPQAESVAFSRDGKSLWVISEGRKSPLVRYQAVEAR